MKVLSLMIVVMKLLVPKLQKLRRMCKYIVLVIVIQTQYLKFNS